MIKKLFLFSVVVLILISPVLAIDPLLVTISNGGLYCGGGATCDVNATHDANLGTFADGSYCGKYSFSPNTKIISARIWSGTTPHTMAICENTGDTGTKCQNSSWFTTTQNSTWVSMTMPEQINVSSSGWDAVRVCPYGGWNYLNEVEFTGYNGTYSDYIPGISFVGYPTDGYSPLEVNFTASGNLTELWSWSFGDGSISNITSGPTVSHTYTNPGIYTVRLDAYSPINGWINYTRPNYILVSNESGMIVNLDVKNSITGFLIQDSVVGIKNTTTGVWRNVTAPTGLVYFSTTDPGYLYPLSKDQIITLAANKTGFKSASETFSIPYNNYRARLFLMPDTVINATGSGTVVANVIRNRDGLTISGASVVLDTGHMGSTNSAGAVTFYNVSAGQRYASVTDVAYQSTQYAFNLSAGETKLIVIQMVRNGETPVPTMVTPGATIAPNSTYDPNDPNSPVYGHKTAAEINIEGGAGVLGMLYMLIQLWPLIVLFAFMKFMKSAFS